MSCPLYTLSGLAPAVLLKHDSLGSNSSALTLRTIKRDPHCYLSIPQNLVEESLFAEKIHPRLNRIIVVSDKPRDNRVLLKHESTWDGTGLALSLILEILNQLLQKLCQLDETPVTSRRPESGRSLCSCGLRDERVVSTNINPAIPLVLRGGSSILDALDIGQAGLAKLRHVLSPLLLRLLANLGKGSLNELNPCIDLLLLLRHLCCCQTRVQRHQQELIVEVPQLVLELLNALVDLPLLSDSVFLD